MKMSDKYKPIGKHWQRVDTVGGKHIYPVRSDFSGSANELQKLYSKIKDAEEEYGTKATVQSEQVSHGHSNRDGQYTEKWVTHYSLMIEVPTYSSKDTVMAAVEHFKEKYGKQLLFKK